jgi:uncharacterized membrane protein
MSKRKVEVSINVLFPVIFVLAILKLSGIINIAWFWIFAPYIIVFGFLGLILIAIVLMFGLAATTDIVNRYRAKKRRERMESARKY